MARHMKTMPRKLAEGCIPDDLWLRRFRLRWEPANPSSATARSESFDRHLTQTQELVGLQRRAS
ncbi:hypothetical protein, partial [Ensifer aridi]|uniref:hypothetical protein n=1 Tax=Ensifer aridi TaxID=1708715 RepID=UPI001AEC7F54